VGEQVRSLSMSADDAADTYLLGFRLVGATDVERGRRMRQPWIACDRQGLRRIDVEVLLVQRPLANLFTWTQVRLYLRQPQAESDLAARWGQAYAPRHSATLSSKVVLLIGDQIDLLVHSEGLTAVGRSDLIHVLRLRKLLWNDEVSQLGEEFTPRELVEFWKSLPDQDKNKPLEANYKRALKAASNRRLMRVAPTQAGSAQQRG
jgi:hypothetical protein